MAHEQAQGVIIVDEEERIINIPLRATKMAPRTKRAKRAIKEIRENIMRHMKVAEDMVWIDTVLNEKIWERGIQNPPSRITVKAVKFDDGLVEVSLPEAPKEEKEPAKEEAKPAKKAESAKPAKEPAKKAEPAKEPAKKPEPAKKAEPAKEPAKKPEPAKKAEPVKEPAKKAEPAKEPAKKAEPAKEPAKPAKKE